MKNDQNRASKGETSADKSIIQIGKVEQAILLIRGQRVMLDADLAALNGVTTKKLKQQVKRNADRFPPDLMFQLTEQEKEEVVTICDYSRNRRSSRYLPYALAEHGAIMLASVLISPQTVQASIYVVRAFVRLRN